MTPQNSLPIPEHFKDVEEYVESLLEFVTTCSLFQTLCGGVHILDFFTHEPSLFNATIPEEWRSWLMACGSMDFLDVLMRLDLENLPSFTNCGPPPLSLVQYIKDIRTHSLRRSFVARPLRQTTLPRHVAVGMIPKKMHEVINFADYVVNLADEIETEDGSAISHFVDFGSGQNYLGRALASSPYNKHIIAVESKELNISGAKNMDVLAKLAEREKVKRNKKLYRQKMDSMVPPEKLNEKALRRAARSPKNLSETVGDLRPKRDLATIYSPDQGQGSIQYVEHVVNNGDLSAVVEHITRASNPANLHPPGPDTDDVGDAAKVENAKIGGGQEDEDPKLMAISVHSCGNLSHHGIRSLLLNPSVKVIAIVGCCYNLVTERLGPPTYKLPYLNPSLRPTNARVVRESAACDPHGFPMSDRVATYKENGIRLNVTARMMAVQAPQNWTEKESDAFFTRHFFRALLQKVFLDKGVVSRPRTETQDPQHAEGDLGSKGTNPVIIGSLRKSCYHSFPAYVRGAIAKLTADSIWGDDIRQKMGDITDVEIEMYAQAYEERKKELSVVWSLMAFSAGVTESLIVVDRWLYLREHANVVRECWVEAVFDYGLSPRNLVVVGVKA